MPLNWSETCPKCGELHGIKPEWENLGFHDCPKCGAEDAIEFEWETEIGMEPITED